MDVYIGPRMKLNSSRSVTDSKSDSLCKENLRDGTSQAIKAWLLYLTASKRAAGDRGFTFLGRAVTKDMTFDDVLKKIPAGELEEAGTAIKSILTPGALKPKDAIRATMFLVLANDPLGQQPGGMVKFLRRKSQDYLDPQAQIMQRRISTGSNYWKI
jgi:hypothetical protein